MKFDSFLYIRKFLNFLTQTPLIGGLDISNSSLKFSIFKNNVLRNYSLKLPPGILEEGKIKDQQLFVQALQKLHHQINLEINGSHAKEDEKIYSVVSLPPNDIYTQIFNLPPLPKKKKEEAAFLNLRMISPININTAYYDWQEVGIGTGNTSVEVLGGFATSKIVEGFIKSLEEVNFSVIAVEFSSLALVRILKEIGAGNNLTQPLILLNVSSEGLEFIVVRNSNLYFNYFTSWKSIQGDSRQIPFSVFKDIIVKNFQQVLNFYSTRWKDNISKVILLSPGGTASEIAKVIQTNFSLPAEEFRAKKFTNLTADWFISLGSALRGTIPREQDIFISLMRVGTEERFKNNQIKALFNFWRNIIVPSLTFLLIIFFFSNAFLMVSFNKAKKQTDIGFQKTEIFKEVDQLQEEADKFNNFINLIKEAQKEEVSWTPFFDKINNLSGKFVDIRRIFFQAYTVPILISGDAPKEEDVISFKKVLSQEEDFEKVELPLSDLKTSGEGVSFRINLSLKESNN